MKKEYVIILVSVTAVILISIFGLMMFGLYLLFGVGLATETPTHIPVYNRCAVVNCHGLDIQCGEFPPEMCTEMYSLGDKCLQHAQCGVVDGMCGQVKNLKFDACKSCVQDCMNKYSDAEAQFQCESLCE
jgi:hypothetical protein